MRSDTCTIDLMLSELRLSLFDASAIGILAELALFLVAFEGLTVAAEHLCNSMETLCERWKINEDVGGATFIAFGGAIPKITINCVSTMKSVSAKTMDEASVADVGVGAILGSGLIAFLVIPSLVCLFSTEPLVLRKKSIHRDASFYICAVLMLMSGLYLGVGKYHGVSLVLLYMLYVFALIFGDHLKLFWGRELGHPHLGPLRDSDLVDPSTVPLLPLLEAPSEVPPDVCVEDSAGNSKKSLCSLALLYPVRYAVDWTCPDCRLFQPRESWYWLAFLTSFGWISLFSFLITIVVGRWIILINLPSASALFGVVLVAAGAEIPDLVNAITIARRGFGGMALSACLGSQVVNICLGIGMPWLTTQLLGLKLQVSSGNLYVRNACVLLLVAVVVSVLTLSARRSSNHSGRSRISKSQAWFLLTFYCGVILIMATSSYTVSP